MAKTSPKTVFECGSCGRTTPKWVGKCGECGEWNTVEERPASVISRPKPGLNRLNRAVSVGRPPSLVELSQVPTGGTTHMSTGIAEFDRVLGGGFVAGSTTLLAGDPGIGKSTLLLQAAAAIAATGRKVLYATGEEALEQIRLRASRLRVDGDGVFMADTGDIFEIASHAATLDPAVVIVDSIQTATHPDLDSPAGTVSQIRECAAFMAAQARSGHGYRLPDVEPHAVVGERSRGPDHGPDDGRPPETQAGTPGNFALVLSGHVTKDGSIAGPRVLEHQVDAVLQMGGDAGGTLRVLHAAKNRFGPTDEVGVFEMYGEGLRGVSDPSLMFIGQRGGRTGAVAGSAVALVVEGTRSFGVEVQALATPSSLASPRRVANGVEMSRVHLITAVLAKHLRLPVSNHDLVISVTGGLDVREPAADLAIALAIASSMMDRPVDESVVMAGEIGLAGELRPVSRADRRIAEAARLGFAKCLVPEADGVTGSDGPGAAASASRSVEVVRAVDIAEAVKFALQQSPAGVAGSGGDPTHAVR